MHGHGCELGNCLQNQARAGPSPTSDLEDGALLRLGPETSLNLCLPLSVLMMLRKNYHFIQASGRTRHRCKYFTGLTSF